MPSQRLTVLPSASTVTKVRSRDALTLRASLSIAKSHETRCQSVAPGARYIGLVIRRREMASCNALAPFGHSRPSLTGLSGSPSSWSSSTVPFDDFFVYATSAQPTAQYGQTEWDTVAPSMRRFCLTCVGLSSLKPSGEIPSAPVLVALSWRNSRRVTSMSVSLHWDHRP